MKSDFYFITEKFCVVLAIGSMGLAVFMFDKHISFAIGAIWFLTLAIYSKLNQEKEVKNDINNR
ncbi:unnamed protein product [marine sediment metagenome]|uniref:Uncharacterized protein n=1 Tax=marine sediment metagenome TaxID=412755 RepID=X0ZEM4_9ZZZZ